MSRPVSLPTPATARGRTLRRFVPPQHGAWAMLLLPWLAGVLTAGFGWPDVPLLLAWLTGYPLSYYALLAVKTRRPGRVRPQLLVYGVPSVLLGAGVVAARPDLLWYAPAYAALFAVNVVHAARRDERALLNDLASVVQSCLMVFACATVAAVPVGDVVQPFTVLLVYFTGTILHVKTMIRERDSVGYRRASVAFHGLAAGAMLWFGPLVAAVFALLLVRAWVMPGRRLRPAQVGIVEIVASLLVLLAGVFG